MNGKRTRERKERKPCSKRRFADFADFGNSLAFAQLNRGPARLIVVVVAVVPHSPVRPSPMESDSLSLANVF